MSSIQGTLTDSVTTSDTITMLGSFSIDLNFVAGSGTVVLQYVDTDGDWVNYEGGSWITSANDSIDSYGYLTVRLRVNSPSSADINYFVRN
jgi:hypothetical protein